MLVTNAQFSHNFPFSFSHNFPFSSLLSPHFFCSFTMKSQYLSKNEFIVSKCFQQELVMSNFSFSHNVFNSNQITVSSFVYISGIISLFAIELEEPKIGISGKGLKSHSLVRKQTFSTYLPSVCSYSDSCDSI